MQRPTRNAMADQVQVVDYRAKYEKLLRETMKEFQTSVKTAQLRAEENSRGETNSQLMYYY